MLDHDKKIQDIVEQVKEMAKSKSPVAFSKNSVPHLVPDPKDPRFKKAKINLRSLNEIISIDKEEKICVAESGVTFSQLVKATLPLGLIPMTVPELKGITIGGAVSGCSIESMSYKFGGFHDSCVEYEIITGEGNVILCSEKENNHIFEMIHGSYGTLGILTKLKFKLIEAKQYVKMDYKSFDNFPDYKKAIDKYCENCEYDFIDGIVHSKEKFVLCLGQMVEKAPYLSNYRWLNIFYKSTSTKKEDYLSLYDYFFRYDTECHWLTKTLPLMESKIFRLFFGKIALGSTNLIKWSKRLRHLLKLKKRPEVVVDVFIGISRFEEFYQWYEKDFNFYPLWIVPYKMKEIYPWVSKEHKERIGEDRLFIDCAIYGKKNSDPKIDYSKSLEDKVYELNGIKTLISRNHYDEKTFWEIYNKENYEKVKSQTDPQNLFANLYKKFHPHNS